MQRLFLMWFSISIDGSSIKSLVWIGENYSDFIHSSILYEVSVVGTSKFMYVTEIFRNTQERETKNKPL